MHPALSVIFFTVISGTGYGLLFLLGAAITIDTQIVSRSEALLALTIGAAFAAAGLTSSLFHLGRPERAWRALSQWRSSWLSREGVVALCSFVPIVLLMACLWFGIVPGMLRGLGAVIAVLAIVTVRCTAGIYTSLKTVRAWHNPYVLPGYLLLGLLGGASWLLTLHAAFGFASAAANDRAVLRVLGVLVLLLSLASAAWKMRYWHFLARAAATTVESATGLGRYGRVRSSEQPHTEENYLTNEMGFMLARKHASRLRSIAVILIAAAPILLMPLFLLFTAPILDCICSAASALLVTAGIFVERWLFFAEAKHAVMAYYGGARN